MSKSESFGQGNLQHMLTSILYSSLKLDEDPVLWRDVAAVKEAVERLGDVHVDYFRPLDEVKEQLSVNPSRHVEFIEFGGADALMDLLRNGNSVMQRKCMRAIEVLAKNEAARRLLRDMGVVDILLDIIRASSKKPESTRRAKSGEILKLLAGSINSAVCFHSPGKVSRRPEPKKRTTRKYSYKHESPTYSKCYQYRVDDTRERPMPYWYFTTNPILPWDSETVSSLVDLLLSDAVETNRQDCAYRIIRKILYIGQLTRHVVVDPDDISDLISIIQSMHSASIHAVKAVTFASIMHSSNGVSFVQRGGLEALVSSLSSDNMGSVCGEVSAWALAHFCRTSREGVSKIVKSGGIEALVELAHSTDPCSREAAVYTIVTLLRNCDKSRKSIIKEMGEADLVCALLGTLEEDQLAIKNPFMLYNTLWALQQMAKNSVYRSDICDLDGVAIIQKSVAEADRTSNEMARRLQRCLSTRNQRLGIVWKASTKKGKTLRSRIVHRLKKVFKNEVNPGPNARSIQACASNGAMLTTSFSMPQNRRKPIPERSISSLSSSIHSGEYGDGMLATAPEGPTGMTLDDFLINNSTAPNIRTYSLQPYRTTGGYDKDFDPFIFGGRPLSKVDEHKNHLLTTGSSSHGSIDSAANPELIATHDFI